MQDSIYFFDQFKKNFIQRLEDEENKRKEFLITGRPEYNEICELRGCLYAIQNIRRIFELLEYQMKEKLEKDGHL
jgi:hypothetical protein